MYISNHQTYRCPWDGCLYWLCPLRATYCKLVWIYCRFRPKQRHKQEPFLVVCFRFRQTDTGARKSVKECPNVGLDQILSHVKQWLRDHQRLYCNSSLLEVINYHFWKVFPVDVLSLYSPFLCIFLISRTEALPWSVLMCFDKEFWKILTLLHRQDLWPNQRCCVGCTPQTRPWCQSRMW